MSVSERNWAAASQSIIERRGHATLVMSTTQTLERSNQTGLSDSTHSSSASAERYRLDELDESPILLYKYRGGLRTSSQKDLCALLDKGEYSAMLLHEERISRHVHESGGFVRLRTPQCADVVTGFGRCFGKASCASNNMTSSIHKLTVQQMRSSE